MRVCNHSEAGRQPETCAYCRLLDQHKTAIPLPVADAPHLKSPLPQWVESRNECNHHEIVIEQGASGIGDALCLAPYLRAIKEDWPDRKLRVKVSPMAYPFLQLFDCYDYLETTAHLHNEMPVHGAIQANYGFTDQQKNHFPTPRGERYRQNIGAARGVLPSLREPKRIRDLNRRYADHIALCPFSIDPRREWSLQHWLTLEQHLLARDYKCVVLHSEATRCEKFHSEKLTGKPADVVTSVLLNAAAVIGSDSGLTHLGGILGKRTIALQGSLPLRKIFGHYPHMDYLEGPLVCGTCCDDPKVMDQRCHTSCAQLQSIDPLAVVNALDKRYLGALCDRSALGVSKLQVLRWELLHAARLPGACAEVGVWRGGSARLFGRYAPQKTAHLFDTFAGIPQNDPTGYGHQQGDFATDPLEVIQAYIGNPKAHYHVGVFDSATAPQDERYCFVHLDPDILNEAMLAYFDSRIVKGGVLLVDDYGWHLCPTIAPTLHRKYGDRVECITPFQAIVRF